METNSLISEFIDTHDDVIRNYIIDKSLEHMILTASKNIDEQIIEEYVKDKLISDILERIEYYRISTRVYNKTKSSLKRYINLLQKVYERHPFKIVVIFKDLDINLENDSYDDILEKQRLFNQFVEDCKGARHTKFDNIQYNRFYLNKVIDNTLFTNYDTIFSIFKDVYLKNISLNDSFYNSLYAVNSSAKREKYSNIFRSIFNDDVESLKNDNDFVFNKNEIDIDYLSLAIQYDSINCFRFLLTFKENINPEYFKYAYINENYEMINLIRNNFAEYIDDDIVTNCLFSILEIDNLELLIYLSYHFETDKLFEKGKEMFPYLASHNIYPHLAPFILYKYYLPYFLVYCCEDNNDIINRIKNDYEDIEELEKEISKIRERNEKILKLHETKLIREEKIEKFKADYEKELTFSELSK